MNSLPTIPDDKLDDLLRRGTRIWDEFEMISRDHHHLFVPCDQRGAYEELRRLRRRAASFVEFGSAAGVVTILADLLGFEAYGIEIEPWLVRRADELARSMGSGATFAEGSFVPPAYQDEVVLLASDRMTPTEGADAFDELGMKLRDFDLVFAYPWPGEEEWLFELMRRHARANAQLMTYDANDGFRVAAVRDL